jgi:hypothetical protein
MTDYTLLQTALLLGGRFVRVTDDRDCASADCSAEAAPTHDTLSTSHISPFIEYRAGASLLKSCKGGQTEAIGGGRRGKVEGFSSNARRRLLQTIGSIRRDAVLPLFITLTYPDKYPDPKTSKRHLDTFFKRFARAFPLHGTIWKLEPQKRGAPHYHLLTWGCELDQVFEFVTSSWHDIAGGGDILHLRWHRGELGNGNLPCVQQVQSFNGVWSYASKYLGKTFDVSGWEDKWTGRYWGVVRRTNIPFGKLIQEPVTWDKAVQVQRYQRRFAGLKKTNRSATIFCDVGQWVDNLLTD